MNHSAKRQHHEKNRKKHKHEQQQHAKDAAKHQRSPVPRWLLIVGIGVMILLVVGSVFLM